MNKFLQLKHWQFIAFFIGLPVVVQIIAMRATLSHENGVTKFTEMMYIVLVFIVVFLSWFFLVGNSLYKRLPDNVKMNVGLFNLFLFISFGFIILLFFFDGHQSYLIQSLLAFPFPITVMITLCYCIYFIAKALVSVELQRDVKVREYAGEFFLISMFLAGIWIIQPRINKLFEPDVKQSSLS